MDSMGGSVARQNFSPSLVYSWYVVGMLLLVGIVSHLDRALVSLLVEPIKADLALSDTQISLLQGTAFAIFFVAFGLPCGALVDRVNRRMVLALGIALWSVSTALGGLANNFWTLFFARAGVGVGEACLAPAAFSLIADYFPLTRRGKAMSTYNMANYVGGGASLLVGGMVMRALGGTGAVALPVIGQVETWQATMILIGLPGVLLSLLIFTVQEPPRQHSYGAAQASVSSERFLQHMREAPGVYVAVHAVSALTAFTGFGVASWMPSYFVRTFALTPAQAGIAVGPVSALCGMMGCILSGICSDWLVSRNAVGGRFLLPLIWWPAALIGLTVLVISPTKALALAGIGIFMLGSGFGLASVVPTIQDITPPQFRGQATAVHFVLAGILAFGSAATVVALVNDYVFGTPKAIGQSMLLVLSPVILCGFLICLAGRKAYDRRRLHFIRPA